MTGPNFQPDFSDPDVINALFNGHPDLSSPFGNAAELIAEAESTAIQLALKESDVFDYLKSWMPGADELHQLVLSVPTETPTIPDLLVELALGRGAVILDRTIPDDERTQTIKELDYTIEALSIISDIAAKMLYPDIEQSVLDIKQIIDNGEYISDTEKAVLDRACDYLL